ncbi:hypothetical protein K469DRAFT_311399 [Zopfia rhizophila CBS 207.26]|uniref:Uncharacterized protein n=1 Tax=Zopfia rhizophila CBS 207.26 TaxID=1314779 RepID=A0A6A6EM98_9PEZI|nr:hypothetical protein K469DRAFT_311399 [Zopfia rhizophila CBS 207.26]
MEIKSADNNDGSCALTSRTVSTGRFVILLHWTAQMDLASTKRSVIDIDRLDGASRDPEGSLKLFFKLPWESRPHLVSLGAPAIVLMLGFGTFAQQAVAIGLKQSSSAVKSVTVSRALTYRPPNGSNPSFTVVDSASHVTDALDLYMAAAMNSGMLDNYKSPSNVSGFCPTNHRTWKPYRTLAICSSAEDISSTIVSQNQSAGEQEFSVKALGAIPPSHREPVTATFWMKSRFFRFEEHPTESNTMANETDKSLPILQYQI